MYFHQFHRVSFLTWNSGHTTKCFQPPATPCSATEMIRRVLLHLRNAVETFGDFADLSPKREFAAGRARPGPHRSPHQRPSMDDGPRPSEGRADGSCQDPACRRGKRLPRSHPRKPKNMNGGLDSPLHQFFALCLMIRHPWMLQNSNAWFLPPSVSVSLRLTAGPAPLSHQNCTVPATAIDNPRWRTLVIGSTRESGVSIAKHFLMLTVPPRMLAIENWCWLTVRREERSQQAVDA